MSRHRRGVSFAGSVQLSAVVPRWKRFLDLALLFLALPMIAPLMLFIAAYIKAVSRGPVLFKQPRIGLDGSEFTCLKFRTMHVNAPTDGHQDYLKSLIHSEKPMIKMDSFGDKRLVRGARWLRSSGLDELPQLLNVLQGEMSWVGPRPGTASEFEHYSDDHKGRLCTLPGLTGLWQVSGKNGTTFEEMIQLDVHYARNKSVSMDLMIILKTPWVLVRQCCETLVHTRRKSESTNQPEPRSEQDQDQDQNQEKRAVTFPVAL